LMNEAIAELEDEGFDCYGEKEIDISWPSGGGGGPGQGGQVSLAQVLYKCNKCMPKVLIKTPTKIMVLE
jgi:hypothetical protein